MENDRRGAEQVLPPCWALSPLKGVGLRDRGDGSWGVSGVGGDDSGWWCALVPLASVGSLPVVVGWEVLEVSAESGD